MCQPKSKGGKRCLAHSNVSKYSVRNVSVKTGASPEVVQKTLVELSREGKNVEQPTTKEVETFIDQQRFKTEIDPELDAHERKIQLNQLDRAKEEVKAGVSGGAWHAWKNIHKTVKAKMKAAKKAVVALGVSGALVFSLAGCGGSMGNNDNTNAPTPPTSTSTSAPVNSATPTAEPTTPTTPPAAPTGDAVVQTDANGNPVVITDQYGSYTPTTINPADDALTVNPATVDPGVASSGWAAEDVDSAQKFAVKFVAEQLNDSIALDRATGWDQWKTEEAPKYIAPIWLDSITNTPSTGSDRSIIISNNFNNATPDLVRDGGSRVSASDISVNQVYSLDDTGTGVKGLVVKGNSDTTYRTVEGKPLYSKTTWAYAMIKSGDSWQITGFDNGFNLSQ